MIKSHTLYRLAVVVSAVLVILVACEKTIDISIPDKERKLVLNGMLRAGEPVIVQVSKSLSVLENDTMMAVTGGDLRLFNGTSLIGRLTEMPGGQYSLPGFVPVVGQTYRITAEGSGLNPVEAAAVIPEIVPILSVDTATLVGEWGQSELMMTIKFNDPAGKKNYYGFGAYVTYKEFDYETQSFTGKKSTYPVYLFGNDDLFLKDESTSYYGKLYFEDLLFDGMQKSVHLGIGGYAYYESDTIWLDVRMEQVDPSFYRYMVSYNAYQSAHSNPFGEPVQVYTNVTNGYGIFSGFSSSGLTLITHGMRKGK
jgi:hypothetical protein